MDPLFTSLGARAASLAAGPIVRKIFVTHTPGAGLLTERTPLARRVAWGGNQSGVSTKDVRRLVRQLVKETLDSDPELHRLRHEPEPLVEALSQTILALGDLDIDDAQAVYLKHDGLAMLLKRAKPQVRKDLPESLTPLYDTILGVCCLHVLEFFSSRPEFAARTQIEHTAMLHEQDRILLSLLERLPDPKSNDTLFEKTYSESLVRRYDELTIFGLDLRNASDNAWPLDTAYLSLETINGGRYDSAEMADYPTTENTVDTPTADAPQRVEKALAGRPRVLMRGVAGSGKTTLIQWLAITAARQEFTDELYGLNILIPFVLPLRTLTRDGRTALPTPDQFLHSVDNMQAGAQPGGWAQRVMSQGRALLLIDGLDEVSEDYRRKTRDWLHNILKEFPETRCVITARPSAVPENWLAKEKFAELALSPMRRPDVHIFVRRWHEAAIKCADSSMTENLESFAQSLLETIDTKPDMARLTTNPLMCALVCALHRDKRGMLPRGRKALYAAALRMLLIERDDQRHISAIEGVSLTEEDQVLLLQRIAYWLIRNGQSEARKETALRMVEEAIPRMPSIRTQAADDQLSTRVFNHLLSRSGLLREPSTDTVEFVHRTFQDYLGARAAIEDEDIKYLIQQAHHDQWEDVIRMAVSHCRPKERVALLTGIINRGDTEAMFRHRLYLLSLVCLEHSPELDPDLQDRIQQRAGTLLPPESIEDAEVLAQVGPVLLELLPGPSGLTVVQACATIRAASLVGGDAALHAIAKFVNDHRPQVKSEVVNAWDRFDIVEYAKTVLNRGHFSIAVRSTEQAAACKHIKNSTVFACVGNGAGEKMAPLLPKWVEILTIADDQESADLGHLGEFSQLTTLVLIRCPQVSSVERLSRASNLKTLMLDSMYLDDYESLQSVPSLQSLIIRDPLGYTQISSLPDLPNIVSLLLEGQFDWDTLWAKFPRLISLSIETVTPIGSLQWLDRWQSLESLSISARDQSEGVTSGLENVPYMRELTLKFILPAYVGDKDLEEMIKPLPRLEKLTLEWDKGQLAVVDISRLARLMPNLAISLKGAHKIRGTENVARERLNIIE
ncbi:NACHT domain-containing protein [Streptomyces sp. CA-256286]|uniref:NACHT domain-containing protein n=1 Tax=Streptomyces sp. CA-256286 TaxID=2801033 RepID=UPI001A9821E0|nr:NACHT domain-containing protein [Streptomyces sp. CA-256286]QTA34067.1 NACHT domain-containing protein [Streptomyces sp. CA-256286]